MKFLKIAIGVVLVYALIGFFLIPYILEKQIPSLIHEHTGRTSTIEKVKLNPFTLSFGLNGFEMKEKSGDRFVAFKDFFVNFQAVSLFKGAYTFDEIYLQEPYVRIDLLKDEQFNFSDMTENGETESETDDDSGDIPPIIIGNLSIENGAFNFNDLSRPSPFRIDLKPLNLNLNQFTTLLNEDSGYTLKASLESGGSLDWQGRVSVNPLLSKGNIRLSEVDAPALWQYIKDMAKFEIKDGQMDFNAAYELDGTGDELQLILRDGVYNLETLSIAVKGRKTAVISVPKLAVEGFSLDLGQQNIVIDTIASEDARLRSWMSADGAINYATLFEMTPTDPNAPDQPTTDNTEDAAWRVQVNELTLMGYGINFEDRGLKEPVKLNLSDLSVNIKNFDTEPGKKLAINLGSKINGTGVIKAGGDLSLQPVSTRMNLELRQIGLEKFKAYGGEAIQKLIGSLGAKGLVIFKSDDNDHISVNYDGGVNLGGLQLKMDDVDLSTGDLALLGKLNFSQSPSIGQKAHYHGKVTLADLNNMAAPYKISSKAIDLDGDLDFSSNADKSPQIRYKGKAKIGGFRTAEKGARHDLARWKELSIRGLDFENEPMRIAIREIIANRPYGKVVIEPSRSKPAPPKKENKTKSSSDDAINFPIKIGRVKIVNGSANFADNTVTPNFATAVRKLNGTVKGLSSNRKARAAVDIKGKVDDYAPVFITGQINPFNTVSSSDLQLKFNNIALSSFSPYSGKFAGYKIEKGKMSVDLNYHLSERKLSAENNIVLNQLTLGDEVDSPDATSLPVSLAIALMKDNDGNIDLDLPISGSLDDPEFSIWGLVGKALFNLITKIVSSPFSLLGSLVEGGEELNHIGFAPGLRILEDSEKEKLRQLASALVQRPQLQIEVKGVVDAMIDRAAVAEMSVLDKMRQELDTETTDASLFRIPLENEDYRELLIDLYEDAYDDEEDVLEQDEALKEKDPGEWIKIVKTRLLAKQPIDDSQLRFLAQERAKAISQFLIEEGQLEAQRLFLLDVDIVPGSEGGTDETINCELSLKT